MVTLGVMPPVAHVGSGTYEPLQILPLLASRSPTGCGRDAREPGPAGAGLAPGLLRGRRWR